MHFLYLRNVTLAEIDNSSIISRTAFVSNKYGGFVPCMVYDPPSASEVTSLKGNMVKKDETPHQKL
jgi:hypothetical protein